MKFFNQLFYCSIISLVLIFNSAGTLAQEVKKAETVKPEIVKPEITKVNATLNFKDNLKPYLTSKKRVVLNLNNGTSYTGLVTELGTHFVVLSQLGSGKDYYEALIKIEDISALEVPTR